MAKSPLKTLKKDVIIFDTISANFIFAKEISKKGDKITIQEAEHLPPYEIQLENNPLGPGFIDVSKELTTPEITGENSLRIIEKFYKNHLNINLRDVVDVITYNTLKDYTKEIDHSITKNIENVESHIERLGLILQDLKIPDHIYASEGPDNALSKEESMKLYREKYTFRDKTIGESGIEGYKEAVKQLEKEKNNINSIYTTIAEEKRQATKFLGSRRLTIGFLQALGIPTLITAIKGMITYGYSFRESFRIANIKYPIGIIDEGYRAKSLKENRFLLVKAEREFLDALKQVQIFEKAFGPLEKILEKEKHFDQKLEKIKNEIEDLKGENLKIRDEIAKDTKTLESTVEQINLEQEKFEKIKDDPDKTDESKTINEKIKRLEADKKELENRIESNSKKRDKNISEISKKEIEYSKTIEEKEKKLSPVEKYQDIIANPEEKNWSMKQLNNEAVEIKRGSEKLKKVLGEKETELKDIQGKKIPKDGLFSLIKETDDIKKTIIDSERELEKIEKYYNSVKAKNKLEGKNSATQKKLTRSVARKIENIKKDIEEARGVLDQFESALETEIEIYKTELKEEIIQLNNEIEDIKRNAKNDSGEKLTPKEISERISDKEIELKDKISYFEEKFDEKFQPIYEEKTPVVEKSSTDEIEQENSQEELKKEIEEYNEFIEQEKTKQETETITKSALEEDVVLEDYTEIYSDLSEEELIEAFSLTDEINHELNDETNFEDTKVDSIREEISLKEIESKIIELENKISDLDIKEEKIKEELKKIESKEKELNDKESKLQKIEETLNQKELELNEKINFDTDNIENITNEINTQNNNKFEELLKLKEQENEVLKSEIEGQREDIYELAELLKQKDIEINNLKEIREDLTEKYNNLTIENQNLKLEIENERELTDLEKIEIILDNMTLEEAEETLEFFQIQKEVDSSRADVIIENSDDFTSGKVEALSLDKNKDFYKVEFISDKSGTLIEKLSFESQDDSGQDIKIDVLIDSKGRKDSFFYKEFGKPLYAEMSIEEIVNTAATIGSGIQGVEVAYVNEPDKEIDIKTEREKDSFLDKLFRLFEKVGGLINRAAEKIVDPIEEVVESVKDVIDNSDGGHGDSVE